MTDANDPLHIKTEPLIHVLSHVSGVRGILCFGSYATGTFDEYSDVDLYVFCHPAILPPQVRREAYLRIPGATDLEINCVQPGGSSQWCPSTDRFRLPDAATDISWNTVEWIKTVVRKVTVASCTSIPELPFRPYTMLGLLETSVILHDPESVLQDLKSALRPYPGALKRALLSESLPIIRSSLEDLKDYARRSVGNTAFHFHFDKILDALGVALFAINERYDPATKRVEEAYKTLRILPRDFISRYGKILQLPLTEEGRRQVVAELDAIAREVEHLAERALSPPAG